MEKMDRRVRKTRALLLQGLVKMMVNITVRRSRQSGVARATCPD